MLIKCSSFLSAGMIKHANQKQLGGGDGLFVGYSSLLIKVKTGTQELKAKPQIAFLAVLRVTLG